MYKMRSAGGSYRNYHYFYAVKMSVKVKSNMSIESEISRLRDELPESVTLVAVSKTYPADDIRRAYAVGQRIFGESRPQELAEKHAALPQDIEWHQIGLLQTNKVKYIAPFVAMIHSVDSGRLLETIEAQAARNDRVIDVLLEVHVAREESKHGWREEELTEYLRAGRHRSLTHVRFRGVMGIATNTDDEEVIRGEFNRLRELRERLAAEFFGSGFDELSMGMSSDWRIAVECGATMVRIGSTIFGARDYSK